MNRHNPRWPSDIENMSKEDKRNLIDPYKYWSVEDVKKDLNKKRHDFVLLLENFSYDFNIAQAIRNSNAFLSSEIWISGRKKFDRRGACGTYHYENIHYEPSSEKIIDDFKSKGYRIVCFDNIDGSESLHQYCWQPKTLMIFGQENIGISQQSLDKTDDIVYIPQYGSTRSINVGSASAIAMFEYTRQINPQ